MKNFLKHCLTRNNLILLAIFLVAVFVRFYNFPNRVTFWSEQARSLIVSAEYLKKPSFLGQEYFRQDINGHMIFSGALFNYSLVPLLLISNYDPVLITIFFALLNLLTGFLIYILVKKMYGITFALLSVFLFLFNDFMIYHSLFIWNYNYLPIVGILVLYFSWLNLKAHSSKNIFILGILSGIGVSLQILMLIPALLVLVINIWRSKNKIKDILFFTSGIILGNLPMVLFDLRHDFYQTRTLWQFLLDTLKGKSDAGFAYYYLLPFWPAFCLIGAFTISKIFKAVKYIGISVLILYFVLNLSSPKINFYQPTGMPSGLKTGDIEYSSKIIASDVKDRFNVSEVLDFDKRAYVFRYYLQYRYGKIPEDVTAYPHSKTIYVLANRDFDFTGSNIWEINSGGKYKISLLTDMGNGFAIFKLLR